MLSCCPCCSINVGMLWITTVSMGLVRLDTNTRQFTTYLLDPTQPGKPERELDGGCLF